jgi:hypothetical protein
MRAWEGSSEGAGRLASRVGARWARSVPRRGQARRAMMSPPLLRARTLTVRSDCSGVPGACRWLRTRPVGVCASSRTAMPARPPGGLVHAGVGEVGKSSSRHSRAPQPYMPTTNARFHGSRMSSGAVAVDKTSPKTGATTRSVKDGRIVLDRPRASSRMTHMQPQHVRTAVPGNGVTSSRVCRLAPRRGALCLRWAASSTLGFSPEGTGGRTGRRRASTLILSRDEEGPGSSRCAGGRR